LYNPSDNSFIVQLEGSCWQHADGAQTTIDFSPNSKYLAYRWNKTVRVYNTETRAQEREIKLDDNNSARSISFSPDGQRILVGCHYDHIQVYSMNVDSSRAFQGSWKGRTATRIGVGESDSYCQLTEP
jgi:WD40 repeat protein